MITQPTLTNEEWELVLELLEQELHELPSEIHHTDRADYREKLQNRRVTVDRIVQTLRPAIEAPDVPIVRETAPD